MSSEVQRRIIQLLEEERRFHIQLYVNKRFFGSYYGPFEPPTEKKGLRWLTQ